MTKWACILRRFISSINSNLKSYKSIGVVNLASHRVFFLHVKKFYLIQSDWLIPKKVTWSKWNRTIPLASSNFLLLKAQGHTHVNYARTTCKLTNLLFLNRGILGWSIMLIVVDWLFGSYRLKENFRIRKKKYASW